MSDAAVMGHAAEPAETPLTPESWGKLGMWVFLAADAMSFGGLIVAYGFLRYTSPNWPVPSQALGINLTAFMTLLLICSSVTMVLSLSAIKRGDRSGLAKFLALTILGGAMFLGCQVYEWTHLIEEGLTISGNPFGSALFGSTFYVMTGFHGCHVFGGVVYLLCILIQSLRGRYNELNHNEVEIVGLYWHFVDLVWILIFTFVYLL